MSLIESKYRIPTIGMLEKPCAHLDQSAAIILLGAGLPQQNPARMPRLLARILESKDEARLARLVEFIQELAESTVTAKQ